MRRALLYQPIRRPKKIIHTVSTPFLSSPNDTLAPESFKIRKAMFDVLTTKLLLRADHVTHSHLPSRRCPAGRDASYVVGRRSNLFHLSSLPRSFRNFWGPRNLSVPDCSRWNTRCCILQPEASRAAARSIWLCLEDFRTTITAHRGGRESRLWEEKLVGLLFR